jgi:hypothetical protein
MQQYFSRHHFVNRPEKLTVEVQETKAPKRETRCAILD